MKTSSVSSPLVACPPVLNAVIEPLAIQEAFEEAVTAAVVEARPISECKFVLSPAVCSTRACKWHRVSHTGLAGPASGWSSACGWKFGGALASLADELPSNLCHKMVCAKCLPGLRASLKTALQVQA